jgi:hypothetical protein
VSPSDVAWAAFDAGTYQLHEAIPELIAVLESPPPAAGREQYLVAAVLDALIQLRGTPGTPISPAVVTPGILERYYEAWPIQTLVLFGRTGSDRDPILRNLLRTASGYRWYAIANLLLARPQPGFAANVVKGLKLELSLAVVDRGSNDRYGRGEGSGGVGDGIGENPRGFPPHAIYSFAGAGAGVSVLSTGPRPVYYSRLVTNEFQFVVSDPINGGPNTKERLAYLDAIVRGQYRFFLNAQTSVTVEWRNERTFRARVADERNKIAGAYEKNARPSPQGRLSDGSGSARTADRFERRDHGPPNRSLSLAARRDVDVALKALRERGTPEPRTSNLERT